MIRKNITEKLYKTYVGGAMSIFSRYPIGKNVLGFDWDVLIILDTCRVDALLQVKDEYEFISEVNSILSIGSTSSEWIAQTFNNKFSNTISDTAYISANAWAEWVIEDRVFPEADKGAPFSCTNWDVATKEQFAELDHIWKNKLTFRGFEFPPKPELVADRAINQIRENDYGRTIVHFSQPHAPYIKSALDQDRSLKQYEMEPFNYLRQGGDRHDVWGAYLDNLRWVLDSVETVLKNTSAEKVAISSDHGEAFGRYGVYGHPAAIPHPDIKRVPWVETTASDTRQHIPEKVDINEDTTAKEQLKALGYIEE